ncbi:MAG: hypothetical protein HYZ71_02595 [Deltaproteobacteria bacterium]|nr:hypothetical protein [Deltaproteobacteria bacterium]
MFRVLLNFLEKDFGSGRKLLNWGGDVRFVFFSLFFSALAFSHSVKPWIIGGKEVPPDHEIAKQTVALDYEWEYEGKTHHGQASGIILSDDLILTAAHCVVPAVTHGLLPKRVIFSVNALDDKAVSRPVVKVEGHPDSIFVVGGRGYIKTS